MEAVHLYKLIQNLKEVFDIVRLVDTDHMEVCELHEDGSISREKYHCYAVWEKHDRCENCISAKSCASNGRTEKFEFVNGEVYHVISKCVILNQIRYALEMVTKTNDETLFEAYGKGNFVKAICKMNEKMYADELTGLKNRRYYNEQKALLDHAEAMALIDIDNFKQINDTYGHPFGDIVLKQVAQCVKESVRKSDTVIRYGGDEIYIIFREMEEAFFEKRLQAINCSVRKLSFADKPELRLTLSIGGYYRGCSNKDPIEMTDRSMYRAKRHRDCIVIYDAAQDEDPQQKITSDQSDNK